MAVCPSNEPPKRVHQSGKTYAGRVLKAGGHVANVEVKVAIPDLLL